ncbi:MAG TPA: PilZ domain-containing protein [Tepidisphaeraceae bacterium]|nr:PilZ domain-containing protein [Tepidisphaeraceae bacterium]
MSTLPRPAIKSEEAAFPAAAPSERRKHRRHDLEQQSIAVERWDGPRRASRPFGTIVDLSAGGVRVRTNEGSIRPDNQIRVRLELPPFAGICPFVDISADEPRPKREWVGWMAVSRVQKIGSSQYDVAGTLVDMEEMDRGMLGLYLSTQPLAA